MLSRESLGTSEVNERANRVDPREVSTDDQRLAAQHIENTSRRRPREAGVRRKPGMVLVVASSVPNRRCSWRWSCGMRRGTRFARVRRAIVLDPPQRNAIR